jgi:DNA mismatch repair protein MutH
MLARSASRFAHARSRALGPLAPPPASLAELELRALQLAGRSLTELAERFGVRDEGPMVHRKGKAGALLERALGAVGGSLRGPDFPTLGVELKTIPLDAQGRVQESTFVCALNLREADRLLWSSSLVREKLALVLWIPLIGKGHERRVGRPCLWRPSGEQLAILEADFDELVGAVAIGKIESLTACAGRWLQVRPKAAHGGVRTRVLAESGEAVWTVPRGFYLRARFTAALLRDPETLAGSC